MVCILNRVARLELIKKVTLKQALEGCKGVNHRGM